MVPRISYASVEKIFIEFANSSPIGNLGRKVSQTLEGFKVAHDDPRAHQTAPQFLEPPEQAAPILTCQAVQTSIAMLQRQRKPMTVLYSSRLSGQRA